MQEPLVTIAIPTYRRPDFLVQAITSALAQTYRNTEILVSDSEGSEDIARLVSSFGDPRLRYRRNDSMTTSLQNAVAMYRAARGEYIGTLHDDDAWESTFLEKLVRPLVQDASLVLSFCDHWVTTPDGVVSTVASERASRDWGRHDLAAGVHRPFADLALVDQAVSFVVAAVFRKSDIDFDDVPDEVGPPYDLWFSYLAARTGKGAYYIPERLTRYREHASSTTETTHFNGNIVFCYERFLADPRLAAVHPALRRRGAPYRLSVGVSLLHAGNAAAARRACRAAVAERPVAVAALTGLSYLPPAAREPLLDVARNIRRGTQWLRRRVR